MNKLELYILAVAITGLSTFTQAQSYPNYQAYDNKAEASVEKDTKTPQANFFPGGRSSANFFENKSVTPDLVSAERKVNYGTDTFHNPNNVQAPIAVPEEVKIPEPATVSVQEESWSTNKDEEETEEVKNLNQNIEKASEQLSDDPRVQEVLSKTKKIKEALFGKTNELKVNDSKTTVISKTPGKATKEIERF